MNIFYYENRTVIIVDDSFICFVSQELFLAQNRPLGFGIYIYFTIVLWSGEKGHNDERTNRTWRLASSFQVGLVQH